MNAIMKTAILPIVLASSVIFNSLKIDFEKENGNEKAELFVLVHSAWLA